MATGSSWPQQLGLGGLLGVLGDRDVVEGHPVELGDVPQRLVVAHHPYHRPTRAPAVSCHVGAVLVRLVMWPFHPGARFGSQFTIDRFLGVGEFDESVPLHRRLVRHSTFDLANLLMDPTWRSAGAASVRY